MALALSQCGRHEDAHALFDRLLECYREEVGLQDPFAATTMANFGIVKERLGRVEEAQQLYKASLEVFRGLFGDDDPRTQKVQGLLDGVADR